MRLATILAVCLAIPTAASGGSITVSGYGTWDSTVSSDSGLSAPGATWSFSFDVSIPLPSNVNTPVTDASYALNGTPIHDTITSAEFYGSSAGGMFDMTFASGGTVAFYGAGIETASFGLIPGTYAVSVDDDHANSFAGPPHGGGGGVVIVGGASVPEPSTLVLEGIALTSLAGLGLARRGRVAGSRGSR
jgi:hypothetical protein